MFITSRLALAIQPTQRQHVLSVETLTKLVRY